MKYILKLSGVLALTLILVLILVSISAYPLTLLKGLKDKQIISDIELIIRVLLAVVFFSISISFIIFVMINLLIKIDDEN